MKITVLVTDADLQSCKLTAEVVNRSSRVERTFCTDDPEAARVLAKSADLLILDPLTQGMDGISFLEQLMVMGLRPGVILLSSYYSPEMLQACGKLGVALCMAKPVPAPMLVQKVEEWADGEQIRLGGRWAAMQKQISEILIDLGMSKLFGYYECCIAIGWLCSHKPERGRITKELYPFLARAKGKTTKGVERNIRYAIEQIWPEVDPAAVRQYFGNTVRARRHRPSNALFLCTLAEYVRNSSAWNEA